MRIGNLIIQPWDRKNCIYRLVAILLILSWLFWGLTIFKDGQRIQQRLEAVQMEAQRKEEQAIRASAYRRVALEQQTVQSGVQNAVDTFKQ